MAPYTFTNEQLQVNLCIIKMKRERRKRKSREKRHRWGGRSIGEDPERRLKIEIWGRYDCMLLTVCAYEIKKINTMTKVKNHNTYLQLPSNLTRPEI